AAPELAEEPRGAALGGLAPDLEPAARDQEERVGGISLPEEPGAAGDLEDAELGEEGVDLRIPRHLEEALDGPSQALGRRGLRPECARHRSAARDPIPLGILLRRGEVPRAIARYPAGFRLGSASPPAAPGPRPCADPASTASLPPSRRSSRPAPRA